MLYWWMSSADEWSHSMPLPVTKFAPLGTIELLLLGNGFVNVFTDSNQ